MPLIPVNQTNLYYEEFGNGEETIVFSHGYLMTHEMFFDQIQILKKHFRCIAYDHRGHGQSESPKAGYDMDGLVSDAAVVINTLSPGKSCHFIGMSTGGYVGLRLALYYPELLKSLVLIDTDAESTDPKMLKQYNKLLFALRIFGIKPLIKRVLPMIFGEKFLTDPNRKSVVDKWCQIFSNQNSKGIYKFGRGIFARKCVLEEINRIQIKTAIIVGDKDVSTPIEMSNRMKSLIPNSTLHIVKNSGHSSPIEEPEAINKILAEFYELKD